jgi:hypothetical protein
MCCFSCKDPPKPSDSGSVKSCSAGPNTEAKTQDNVIDFVFDPDKSTKVAKCDRIVHVQFIKMSVDGAVIKPGDLVDKFKHRDSATTDDGWYVDPSDAGFSTPDYQQTGVPSQVIGNDGKKNGGAVKAKTQDSPNAQGDIKKGFYNATTNPSGWKEVVLDFATFGYCMAGPDCGKWYEGITWQYKKTSDEFYAGKTGTSTITNTCVDGPSAQHLAAFDKFNKREGFTPCKK